jgi:cell division protein FtsN
VSPERHFEIIISGRQLAGVIALVAALLLIAFGLGVGVGLLEPRGGRAAAEERAWSPATSGEAMPADRTFVQAAEPTPPLLPTATPDPMALLAGEGAAPPVLPGDIVAAATPAALVASPAPAAGAAEAASASAAPPTRAPRPTPTPRPRPTATPRPTAPPQFWIQVSALSQADQAEGVRQRVIALGFAAEQVLVLAGTGGKYRVRLGPFPDQESADRVEARLRAQGFPDAYRLRE